MEEIDFEISSPSVKALVAAAEELNVKQYLYPKTLYGNRHFVVFIPPVANGDVNSPDNIYIDDDFYSIDEPGEFTLSYGFGHIHFEAIKGDYEDAAKRAIGFVKDLIEGKTLAFHLRTEYGLEVTGYTLNQSDEDLKQEFLSRCKNYASYADDDEKDDEAFVRVCSWNCQQIKKINLL